MKTGLCFLFCILSGLLVAQPAGYQFSKQITINASNVSGSANLNDFPLLFSEVDTNLRHVNAGGEVENANGYDIVFTEGDCNTLLDHQIEVYDSASGEFVAWVKLSSLSATQNSVIYMFYGNSSISADPSTDSTFSSDYLGVYHFNENVEDFSTPAYDGTNNGSTNDTSAKIGPGRTFVDPNHWVELLSIPELTSDFTISAWINTSANTRAGQRVICDDENNASGGFALSLGDPGTGRLRFYIRGLNPISLDSPSNAISNSTWYYVSATFDETNRLKRLYIDGSLVASQNITGTFTSSDNGDASIGGETASGETGNRFNGSLDEARILTVVRDSNWLITEYNNQNSPSTFYTLGAQDSASPCTPLSIEELDFSLENHDDGVLLLAEFITSKHLRSVQIQSTDDMEHWENLHEDHSGNYKLSYLDRISNYGKRYYRLLFHWMDGSYEYGEVQVIYESTKVNQELRYLKEEDVIEILVPADRIPKFRLTNSLGQPIELKMIKRSDGHFKLDCSTLPHGYYSILLDGIPYSILKH